VSSAGAVFEDAFGRVRVAVTAVLDGLRPAALEFQTCPEANTIAWLVWHLSRVQDDHIAEVAELEQVWTSQGWDARFGLPLPTGDTGYGHSSEQMRLVVAESSLLLGYHDAVYAQTLGFVRRLGDIDLDRIVDERWDPPVTLGVRLMSVVDDDLEHAGQAAYVRGLAERRRVVEPT
jgi:Protein of unknown function (DUF664)